jgi:hypothetical protein
VTAAHDRPKCNTCRWWEPTSDTIGMCGRFPVHVRTNAAHWCGEQAAPYDLAAYQRARAGRLDTPAEVNDESFDEDAPSPEAEPPLVERLSAHDAALAVARESYEHPHPNVRPASPRTAARQRRQKGGRG